MSRLIPIAAIGLIFLMPQGQLEEFKGVTTNGKTMSGLFKIQKTGATTDPIRKAAEALAASYTEDERKKGQLEIDAPEWRMWDNRSGATRHGLGLEPMDEKKRELVLDLLKASLSAKGYKTSRDIMHLDETLAEITGNRQNYGEWKYWITLMGKPSATEPWGWQLNGHHLVINFFVLGDQVVMTPTFLGAEPAKADSGKYKGTAPLETYQEMGLAMMKSLDNDQQAKARIATEKGPTNNIAEAYKDNVVLDNAGLPASKMTDAQRKRLIELISEYVGNLRDPHAKVRMNEVVAKLDETHFAWIGAADPQGIFYYRIQSPVILIEFDHQRPAALRNSTARNHIHAVVRTPNGNDYGKDLLRQHHEHHHH